MQTYQEFVEKSQKLHKLEEDADYSKRYKEFQGMTNPFTYPIVPALTTHLLLPQEIWNTLAHTRKHFNRTHNEFQKAMEVYRNFMERWNTLRFAIAKCCIVEFQEMVEITFPPRPL